MHRTLPIAMAVLMASIMLAVPATQMFEGESDGALDKLATAELPTGPDYMYVLKTNADNAAVLDVQASVDGSPLESKYRVRSNSDEKSASTTANGTWKINKFWDFDKNTGLGPFNCFYAAFNTNNTTGADDAKEIRLNTAEGTVAYILDPNNLKKTLVGTEYSIQQYNIMLVIPTAYWISKSVTEGGVKYNYLYVTSDKNYPLLPSGASSSMVAYAHTFNTSGSDNSKADFSGTPYKFIAIGVYEGNVSNGVLLSKSGVAPTNMNYTSQVMHTVEKVNAKARNAYVPEGSAYQTWNFYQWTLYKIMSYTVIGTKNVQEMVGYGHAASGVGTAGECDGNSPYYGTSVNSNCKAKLFIENAWGSRWDVVGSTYAYRNNVWASNPLGGYLYGSGNSCNGDKIYTGSTRGQVAGTSTGSANWDIPNKTGGDTSHNLNFPGDYFANNRYDKSNQTTYNYLLTGGGAGNTTGCGLTYWRPHMEADKGGICSRLAYAISDGAIEMSEDHLNVTFDANGGSGSTALKLMFNQNDSFIAPSNLFTPPANKYFDGWSFDKDAAEADIKAGSTYQLNYSTDKKLYAIWVNVPVTFKANNETSERDYIQYIEKNVSTPLKTLAEIGFTEPQITYDDKTVAKKFLYWTVGAPGGSVKYSDGDPVTLASAITLYANWAYPVYKVTFVGNMMQEFTQYVDIDDPRVVKPADPSSPGFHFMGWFTDPNFDSEFRFVDGYSVEQIVSDRTLYAKWLPEYTIQFDCMGAVDIENEIVTFGELATQPAEPVKEGYSFDGWYNGYSMRSLYPFEEPVSSDAVLVAKWTATGPDTHTVSFDTGGGTYIAPQTVVEDDYASRPKVNPAMSNFDFTGWYSDSAATELFSFSSPINKDTTIFAGWEEHVYTLVLDPNGGFGDEIVLAPTVTEKVRLSDASRLGYELRGWCLDSEGHGKIFNGTVSGLGTEGDVVVLYAIWMPAIDDDDDILEILTPAYEPPAADKLDWPPIAAASVAIAAVCCLIMAVIRRTRSQTNNPAPRKGRAFSLLRRPIRGQPWPRRPRGHNPS